MSDPFRSMNDEDARVPRMTRAVIEKQIEAEVSYLADNLAKGIEDYRFRAGRVAGLREALEICQEVEKKIGG